MILNQNEAILTLPAKVFPIWEAFLLSCIELTQ